MHPANTESGQGEWQDRLNKCGTTLNSSASPLPRVQVQLPTQLLLNVKYGTTTKQQFGSSLQNTHTAVHTRLTTAN